MSRKKGLIDKLKADELVKEKGTSDNVSMLFSNRDSKPREEFEKKRQTIYLKENLAHSLKYKAFVEETSMTDIINELLEEHLSEEVIELGKQKAREQ